MSSTATHEQVILRATHVAQVGQDTWTLGAITATTFREVTEGCLAAIRELSESDDAQAAWELLDDAEALLDALS